MDGVGRCEGILGGSPLLSLKVLKEGGGDPRKLSFPFSSTVSCENTEFCSSSKALESPAASGHDALAGMEPSPGGSVFFSSQEVSEEQHLLNTPALESKKANQAKKVPGIDVGQCLPPTVHVRRGHSDQVTRPPSSDLSLCLRGASGLPSDS